MSVKNFINKKIKNIKLNIAIRNELKRIKKEKRRCHKEFYDWIDDEYNCGALKFIWGIKSKDDLSNSMPSFHTLNDIEIHYNRDNGKYFLSIETIYEFSKYEDICNYLRDLLSKLEYGIKKELGKFDISFDPKKTLMYYNNGELFTAYSLTELYYKFKIFVEGFANI